MEALNRSLDVDWRLWPHDVRGSRAWARGLQRAGVLSPEEASAIDQGLASVAGQLEEIGSPDGFADEDVHTLIERLLTEHAGPVGGKLHTGRSRNDQVATAFRLWGMQTVGELQQRTDDLARALSQKADAALEIVMPAYTHLQQAQPVPAAHWLLSRAWPLVRDLERLRAVAEECAVMPLGSGAVAGCPFDVDRERLAEELGFRSVSENSIDAVSDRDWVAGLLFACAMTGVHVSQLAEDLVIFSSAEFGFAQLGSGFATGSSLMPQKRNPDVAELARGKSGRLIGNLAATLAVLKGMPTGYNRDLQEDKEAAFDSVDTLGVVLPAMTGAVASLSLDRERAARGLNAGLCATDLAEHLVRRGVPFRESHHAVGALVRAAEASGRALDELTLDEMRNVHPAFGDDAHRVFDPAASVESRAVRGATSATAVKAQQKALSARLDELSRSA